MTAADSATRRAGFHEDMVATIVGLTVVALALAMTWAARPADAPGSRGRWPKGWPTPLARTIDKPQTWADSPAGAFRDKRGNSIAVPVVLGAACRAKKEELSLAIGLSLFFTVIMMVAMPPVIDWLRLDPILGGAWIGGTIDATGAVVAAGESLGKEAGEVAATVKMIQNSMIGIIAFAVAVYWAGWVDRSAGPREGSLAAEAWRRFPRFILGFLAASLLCSWIFSSSPEGALWVDGTTTGFTSRLRGWLFCAGFVCMGLQTNVRELAPVLASGRPLVLYVGGQLLNLVLTLAMASLTFGWLFKKVVEP